MSAVAAPRRIGRPPSAKHGTRSKYNRGCHCERCRIANRDYQRQREGTRRYRVSRRQLLFELLMEAAKAA